MSLVLTSFCKGMTCAFLSLNLCRSPCPQPVCFNEPRDRTSHGQKLYQNFTQLFVDFGFMSVEVSFDVMEQSLDGYGSGEVSHKFRRINHIALEIGVAHAVQAGHQACVPVFISLDQHLTVDPL